MFDVFKEYWWIFVAAGAVIILGVLILALRKPRVLKEQAGKVFMKKGERFTKDKNILVDGEVNITYNPKDKALEKGEVYRVGKGKFVVPGKYTVLSADKNTDSFNIRIGGVVREYLHATEVVLAEGDEISPRSHNIILR